jgi:hypothetical protein
MSYVGNVPTTAAFPFDQFSGDGSTTAFTLSYAPAGSTSIIVSISGVVQNPNTYSVSGTTLTFTPAPPTGTSNIAVLYLGLPVVATLTPGNTAYFSSSVFTATASQTVFTPSGTYQVGFINVIRNGSQLAPADYTATNGTTVTLVNPCTAGDTVVIEVFNLTSISGALPLTGGTVTGATTFNAGVNLATTSGSVGIGTSSPIRKLTVAASSSPEFVLQETSGSTDAKNWRIFNSGNRLYFGTLNDAGTSGADTFSINSSGVMLNAASNPVLRQTGSVLQVQNVYLTSTTQLTSSGALHELTTSLRIAFTPVSASSTIFLECYGSFVSPQSNNLQYAAFYNVTNAAYINLPPASGSRKQVHWFNRTTSFDVNDAAFMYFCVPVANTTTTARTYTVYHGTEGSVIQFLSSTLSTVSGATYPLYFQVTEVAA